MYLLLSPGSTARHRTIGKGLQASINAQENQTWDASGLWPQNLEPDMCTLATL